MAGFENHRIEIDYNEKSIKAVGDRNMMILCWLYSPGAPDESAEFKTEHAEEIVQEMTTQAQVRWTASEYLDAAALRARVREAGAGTLTLWGPGSSDPGSFGGAASVAGHAAAV